MKNSGAPFWCAALFRAPGWGSRRITVCAPRQLRGSYIRWSKISRNPHKSGESLMPWYNHIAAFFAGLFLANAVPHFVLGGSGNSFPTPFAKPPGKGLSSPTVNVLWALLNLVIGYILFRVGKLASGGDLALAIFFAGIAAISTVSSLRF